ncbi:hypothetical protein AeNC1_005776 [Aphanomyces euteiches]|nr:hypothetical protein AeNC1_005776 [Aphanomyces euteiches]
MRIFMRSLVQPARHCRRGFLSMPEFMQPSNLRKVHREKKVVPFSCQEMFDVVANVDAYTDFLPFCVASRVVRRPAAGVMEADLTIGFQIFTETYRSRVLMESPNRILISSIESPTFKSIESEWLFRELSPTSCEVQFRVSFEVASILHAHAMRLFFDDVARVQLNAFIKQATNLQRLAPPPPPQQPVVFPSIPRPLRSLQDKIDANDIAQLRQIFTKHAKDGRKLLLSGFGAACKDLVESSEWAQESHTLDDVKTISDNHNSALASVVFASYMVPDAKTIEAGGAHDWLSFEEFAMGLYMTLYGTVDEKAVHLFQVIDSSNDGFLSPDELRRAMEGRIRIVKDIFPMLLKEQVGLHSESSGASRELIDECMKVGLMAIETLLAQVETDIPLAVNQIFLSTNLKAPNRITLDEWCRMWYAHPELVEMMTIDGMKKIMKMASVVTPSTKSSTPSHN